MRRIDRQSPYTVPIWVGLFISGIYVLTQDQVDPLIGAATENLLAAAMTLGAGLCLAGVATKDRLRAYQMEFVGLLITVVVLGFLATAVDLSLVQQFTLSGGLGALVQIGSIRMMWILGKEIREAR